MLSEPILDVGDGRVLRPLRDEDADAITSACQDPATVRWTMIPHPYTREHAVEFLRNRAGEDAAWAMASGPERALQGVIGVRGHLPAQPGASAEVGYWVAPWARGTGWATGALGAVRDHLATVGVVRINWASMVGNAASIRVAQKAGFTIEGYRRRAMVQRGQLVDCWVGGWVATDPATPEIVAGVWQLLPCTVTSMPADLQAQASAARYHWSVHEITTGQIVGHVIGIGSTAVNLGAPAAAEQAAGRFLAAG